MSEPAADPAIHPETLSLQMTDGARADLMLYRPQGPVRACLLWVPAMGVSARHYQAFARALAARGVMVGVHEWRGHGSSDRRAGRRQDWGYRELLGDDLPHSLDALRAAAPGVPVLLGGHSLGGQLACLLASTTPVPLSGVVLVATGAPYWRRFKPWTYGAYVFAPLLAKLVGRLPGHSIGFGGNEARGVIADWGRSGRTGRYAARGMPVDFEAALARQKAPVHAWLLREDWLAPLSSLEWLQGKMPAAAHTTAILSSDDLGGAAADHFAWMKAPDAVAARIANAI